MSILPFNNPILSTRRKGDDLDPFIPLVQSILVKENKVLLSEIPSQFEHVTVSGLDVTWTEIYKDLPNEDNFLVDYSMGLVYFHPSRNNSELQFTFKGTGCQYFPMGRVWTLADGTTVTQTLDEVVARAQGIILDVDELNDAVLTAQNLKNELDSDISTGSTLHTNLGSDIAIVSPLVSSLDTAISNSVVAKNNLDGSISSSSTAKNNLDSSINIGNQLKTNLDSDISTGSTLHTNLSGDISTGSSLHTTLSEDITLVSPLVSSLDDSISNATIAKNNLDGSISTSVSSKSSLDESITTGNLLKSTLDSDISTGNDLNTTLLGDISTGNSLNTTLLGTISTADTSNTNLISTNSIATTKKSDLDGSISNSVTAKNNIDGSISVASSTKINLDSSNTVALATKTSLDGSNTTALGTKDLLDNSNSTGVSTKSSLDSSISTGNTLNTNLTSSISSATTKKDNLDSSIDSATTANGTLTGTIETANTSISELNAISDAFQLIEAYDPLHPYIPLNKVTYNGSTYQCILASTGNLPTNTTYWILIAMAGTGAVSSVTSSNNDISIATTTSTPVLTLNSGITANQILKLNSDAKIPTVDGSLLTGLVKSQVGLSDVDNSADSAKNVLSATKLTTPRNINGVAFDGTENITIEDSTKEPTITTKNTAFNKNYETTSTNIKMNGTQAVGDSDTIARGNHIHPSDTSKANLTSNTFTGNQTAPVFISNIATGTAPLQVISTTKVAGLNVEQVDGHDAGTSADNVLVLDGSGLVPVANVPNLSWNKITTDKPTTITGYGITDAYTKTEIDGKTGTLSTLTTTSKVIAPAINEVKASVDAINATNQTQPLTIPHGLSIVTTDRETPINAFAFNGITRLNILGKDGNCEDISKWGYGGCSISLDSSNYAVGSNSIKITLTGTSGSMSNLLSKYNVDTTKYYVLLGYVKNGNATNVFIYKEASGGGTNKLCQTITDTTKFNSTYVKIQPSDLGSGNYLAVAVNGTSGQYAYVDGIRLYPIDQAIYNLIDVDPEYTGDKLAEKYPYVDSYQVLQNPMVTVAGINHLPPFSQWSVGSNATIISPYTLQIVSTGGAIVTSVRVPAIQNTAYYLSFNLPTNAGAQVAFINSSGTTLGYGPINGISNTPTGTVVILISFYSTVAGTYLYTNPMLNLGSTALPFEPANPSYKYFPCKLADGETLQEIDGQTVKTKKIQDVVLDGSLGYTYSGTITGVKKIVLTLPVASNALAPNIVKYDGKIIKPYSTGDSSGDVVWFSSTVVEIWISSADSGWGDSIIPTSDEMKAYFYGYKMNNGTFGTVYDGTGTKTWTAWSATSNTGSVTVCPTTPSSDITNKVYDYYQLHYTLATPTTEIIQPEGSLALIEGANQVELGEGVIVRESVIPYYNGSTYYLINDIAYTSSYLKNRTNIIYGVYKNDILDPSWQIDSVFSYGKMRAIIIPTLYDPTASYSVTYEVLDKYLYTTNVADVSGSYDTNDHTVLQSIVGKVEDVETRVSVVEAQKANRQQPNWITPTLLNGWVNFDTSVFDFANYYKDEFGLVRVTGYIKSGTVGGVCFILPKGYRPLKQHNEPSVSANTVPSYIATLLSILPSGGVYIPSYAGNAWVSISFSFRAEQ